MALPTTSFGLGAATLGSTASSLYQYTLNNTDLEWNTWTPWSECSMSCASGQRLRFILCEGEEVSQADCKYTLRDINNVSLAYGLNASSCNTEPCPKPGYWLDWSTWSECSATCDTGTKRRQRLCEPPQYGGRHCPSSDINHEAEFCFNYTCASDEKKQMTFQEEQEKIPFKESDKRSSAISTGVLSMALILVELVVILTLDALTFYRQAAIGLKNIKHWVKNMRAKKSNYRKIQVEAKKRDDQNSSDGFALEPNPKSTTLVEPLMDIDKG